MSDEFTPINEIEQIIQSDKSKSNNEKNNSNNGSNSESMTNIMGFDINIKQLVWLMVIFFVVVNPYTIGFLVKKIPFLRSGSDSGSSFDDVMSASDMKYNGNNVNTSGNGVNPLPLLLVQGGLYGALVLVLTALLQMHYI
jgi:hypothetical protein